MIILAIVETLNLENIHSKKKTKWRIDLNLNDKTNLYSILLYPCL